jgi:hypothetical protein
MATRSVLLVRHRRHRVRFIADHSGSVQAVVPAIVASVATYGLAALREALEQTPRGHRQHENQRPERHERWSVPAGIQREWDHVNRAMVAAGRRHHPIRGFQSLIEGHPLASAAPPNVGLGVLFAPLFDIPEVQDADFEMDLADGTLTVYTEDDLWILDLNTLEDRDPQQVYDAVAEILNDYDDEPDADWLARWHAWGQRLADPQTWNVTASNRASAPFFTDEPDSAWTPEFCKIPNASEPVAWWAVSWPNNGLFNAVIDALFRRWEAEGKVPASLDGGLVRVTKRGREHRLWRAQARTTDRQTGEQQDRCLIALNEVSVQWGQEDCELHFRQLGLQVTYWGGLSFQGWADLNDQDRHGTFEAWPAGQAWETRAAWLERWEMARSAERDQAGSFNEAMVLGLGALDLDLLARVPTDHRLDCSLVRAASLVLARAIELARRCEPEHLQAMLTWLDTWPPMRQLIQEPEFDGVTLELLQRRRGPPTNA